MGNSASTRQRTKPLTPVTDKRQNHDNEGHHGDQQPSVQPNVQSPTSFQFSITKPTTIIASHRPKERANELPPMTRQQDNNSSMGWTNRPSFSTNTSGMCATIPVETTTATSPRSVPGRAGWISTTSGSNSWSSTFSGQKRSHHSSFSGPYYRARGMSINQQDENLSSSPPGLQLQQIQLDPSTHSGVPTIITWSQGGNNVHVTGTFNHWKQKIKLVKSTHDFNTVLDLPPGTHRLKFIVDDQWRCSHDMETATDPDGNLVNYLQVVEKDDTYTSEEEEETPHEEYTSIIPNDLILLSEGHRGLSSSSPPPEPPCLPPHLETVLLNTVNEEDNSVLSVPNHVALNHLYAQSIKDQVLALSTTTRYRKKYVTTMYYKPLSL